MRSILNKFYHVWGWGGLYTVRSKLNEFRHVFVVWGVPAQLGPVSRGVAREGESDVCDVLCPGGGTRKGVGLVPVW